VNFGDVVLIDFGHPVGSEAGFHRPGIVVTSDAFLRFRPSTVFVVPMTTRERLFPSHVPIEPDRHNGLSAASTALVEQMRAVAVERCAVRLGNVGPLVAAQLLDILAMITGMP
jgi:mRNA interferase MazF